jgi:hypothetical protein
MLPTKELNCLQLKQILLLNERKRRYTIIVGFAADWFIIINEKKMLLTVKLKDITFSKRAIYLLILF